MIEAFLALSCKNCGKNGLIETPKRKKKNLYLELFKKVSQTKWDYTLECPYCQSTNKYSKFSLRFTYIGLLIGALIGLVIAILF